MTYMTHTWHTFSTSYYGHELKKPGDRIAALPFSHASATALLHYASKKIKMIRIECHPAGMIMITHPITHPPRVQLRDTERPKTEDSRRKPQSGRNINIITMTRKSI